jgi:hypothetical protein
MPRKKVKATVSKGIRNDRILAEVIQGFFEGDYARGRYKGVERAYRDFRRRGGQMRLNQALIPPAQAKSFTVKPFLTKQLG